MPSAHELNAKIELYFASPHLSRKDYREFLITRLEEAQDPIAFSPLHIRRQEIYYAMGKNVYTGADITKALGIGPINTTAISMIVNQCLIMGKRFFDNETHIFTDFMDINPKLAIALKLLRDADQHEPSPLRYSGRNGSPRRLFFLRNDLDVPIIFAGKQEGREDYNVSPLMLHSSFEAGMNVLEEYFLNPTCEYRSQFNKTISIKNWYRFIPVYTPQTDDLTQELEVHPSEAPPLSE